MQNLLTEFAKEHLVGLAYATAWYVLAGVIAALFARKTRIDAWCEANPALALVLNFLRATGFDFWKILSAMQTLASVKSKLPPVGPAAVLLLAVSVSATQVGCGASALHPKIEQALLFEDQVHAQVKNLEGVFDATLLMMPEAQRPEWQARLAFAKQQLGTALEAKDAALRAALAASDSTVDISAVVGQIVAAVTGIVEIVDAMGASKLVVANARAKAMTLKGGL